MNFTNNNFPFFNGLGIGCAEFFRMSCSTVGENRCIEFYKLFAYWFFMPKEWVYFIKNNSKRFSNEAPRQLISSRRIMGFSIDEMNLSSKSPENPFENWSLGVITLKLNLIDIIWFVFGAISLDTKTAFCINKSSQISKIFFGWRNGISMSFKFNFMTYRSQIDKVLKIFHFLNMGISFLDGFRVSKINKKLCFVYLFNKIWQYILGKWNRLVSFKVKIVDGFSFWRIFIHDVLNASPKHTTEPRQNFWINRRYDECRWILRRGFVLIEFASNAKTTVSVYIASRVGQSSIFYICFHNKIMEQIGT